MSPQKTTENGSLKAFQGKFGRVEAKPFVALFSFGSVHQWKGEARGLQLEIPSVKGR